MSGVDLEALEALARAGDRRTWKCGTCGHRIGSHKACSECTTYYLSDPLAARKAFEVAACNAALPMVEEIRELRAEVRGLMSEADDARETARYAVAAKEKAQAEAGVLRDALLEAKSALLDVLSDFERHVPDQLRRIRSF